MPRRKDIRHDLEKRPLLPVSQGKVIVFPKKLDKNEKGFLFQNWKTFCTASSLLGSECPRKFTHSALNIITAHNKPVRKTWHTDDHSGCHTRAPCSYWINLCISRSQMRTHNITRSVSNMCSRDVRVDRVVPLQDVQRHVELWFIRGRRSGQFALCVSWDHGTISQGESVQRAECMAVPQYWKDTNREKNATSMYLYHIRIITTSDHEPWQKKKIQLCFIIINMWTFPAPSPCVKLKACVRSVQRQSFTKN